MEITEVIRCRGPPNIQSLHKSTFEITKEEELTLSGDCIIGVGADKGCADLSEDFKKALQTPGAELITVFSANGVTAMVTAKGAEGLSLTDPEDMVWRKSSFVCGRTIATAADAAARDLPRELIEELKKGAEMTVTLSVRTA